MILPKAPVLEHSFLFWLLSSSSFYNAVCINMWAKFSEIIIRVPRHLALFALNKASDGILKGFCSAMDWTGKKVTTVAIVVTTVLVTLSYSTLFLSEFCNPFPRKSFLLIHSTNKVKFFQRAKYLDRCFTKIQDLWMVNKVKGLSIISHHENATSS